ncbi:lasso peptide biosynthesis protein [Variovorax sp. LjRoot290]|uniref:hypothetical protein n=1 Tax=Variovorax sp. LjRoot290 TaxID=3342316 RepID=UPI003ED13064
MSRANDPRRLTPSQRNAYALTALHRAKDLARSLPQGDAIVRAYGELLKYVVKERYCGACHSASAILHMVLAELGVNSTLYIGEVGIGRVAFDHSWLEVDGKIFDVAVCMPDGAGELVGGPVFASTDLASGERTRLVYGVATSHGLGPEAGTVLGVDLSAYAAIQPQPNIWVLGVALAARAGIEDPRFQEFQVRYGNVRRTLTPNDTTNS